MPPIAALSDNDAQCVMVELAQRTEFRQLYPNLSKLAAMGVVIPMSTADAERGFLLLIELRHNLETK